MKLNTEYNFHRPGEKVFYPYRPGDDFYEALIEMHRDLSDEQSQHANSRLILMLANHIGDLTVLQQAMEAARKDL